MPAGIRISGVTYAKSVTIDNTASAYTDGKAIGTRQVFTGVVPDNGGGGLIVGAKISNTGLINGAMDLVLFSQTFTGVSDNATFDVSDADNVFCQGRIAFTSANWITRTSNSFAEYDAINKPIKMVDTGKDMYCQMVARGSMTFVNTSAMVVTLYIWPD